MELFWWILGGVAFIGIVIWGKQAREQFESEKADFAKERGWRYLLPGTAVHYLDEWIVEAMRLKQKPRKIKDIQQLVKGRYRHVQFWSSVDEGTAVHFLSRKIEANLPWTFFGDKRAMPFHDDQFKAKFHEFRSPFMKDPTAKSTKFAEWFSATDDQRFLETLTRSAIPSYMNDHGPKALLFVDDTIAVFGRLTGYEDVEHAAQFLEHLLTIIPPDVWQRHLVDKPADGREWDIDA